MGKKQCEIMDQPCDCDPATKACTKRIDSGNCDPNKKQTKSLLDFGEQNGRLAEAMTAMQIVSVRWTH